MMARSQNTKKRTGTTRQVAGAKRKRSEEKQLEARSNKAVRTIKQETQDCDICAETKTVYRNFPKPSKCEHQATVCSDCYTKQFVAKIEGDLAAGWTACTCPLCNESVAVTEAQSIVPRALFKEVDNMVISVRTIMFRSFTNFLSNFASS